MRRTSAIALCLLAVALIGLAGCGSKLNAENTVKIDPARSNTLTYDPPTREQKVTIVITSPGAPVSAYLLLEKDRAAGEKAVEAGRAPDGSLASKEKIEEATLEATIPAKTGFVLVLGNASAKEAQVKVKATGK